jgi:enamine deaminase RidA (YjgF/YER057c/UK114 family)
MTPAAPDDLAQDRAAIEDMLIHRDVTAFVARDWDAVADDFDAASFVGYSGASGQWRLEFPELAAYRDSWLSQAADLGGRGVPDLATQLAGVQRLASVEVRGDRALVRKVFDGTLRWDGGSLPVDWQTYYFLRRDAGRWLITGFAGYLPRDGDAGAGPAPTPVHYPTATQHTTAGPYSPVTVVRPGSLVVLSGQGPLDAGGGVVGANIAEQTRVTLENCRTQLATAGCSLDDVFKVTAYLADLADWPAFNAVYAEVMRRPLPVRTAIGVSLLMGMRVEIEMWAAR